MGQNTIKSKCIEIYSTRRLYLILRTCLLHCQLRKHELDIVMQGGNAERSSVLEYVFSMLEQLRLMAEADKCGMLAYLIEMAMIEARDEIEARKLKQVRGKERNSAA